MKQREVEERLVALERLVHAMLGPEELARAQKALAKGSKRRNPKTPEANPDGSDAHDPPQQAAP